MTFEEKQKFTSPWLWIAVILCCAVVPYKPISDYGGWGIRYGSKGKAYNVRGNKGLQLFLKNGKKLLIGTQKAPELSNFLIKFQS